MPTKPRPRDKVKGGPRPAAPAAIEAIRLAVDRQTGMLMRIVARLDALAETVSEVRETLARLEPIEVSGETELTPPEAPPNAEGE